MAKIPEVVLNSGRKIPVMGLGTAAYPFPPPELVQSSVFEAIKLGYRHFDSASIYQSEIPIGRAIAQALQQGLIESREDVFITSKLWCTDAHRDLVVPALQKTLQALDLEYLDLFLIHFPARLKGEASFEINKENLVEFDIKGTWEGMEECQRLGLSKSIGVSNFSIKKLSQLLAHATVTPAVNQVEMHPFWQQIELREFCAKKNIHVSAYSPLGGKGAFWGSEDVLNSKELQEIALAKGKGKAQICLRWAFEQGVSFLPKSFSKERMKENTEIFDWELSKEDIKKINRLPQRKIYDASHFISADHGQYKSVLEFWDCEI